MGQSFPFHAHSRVEGICKRVLLTPLIPCFTCPPMGLAGATALLGKLQSRASPIRSGFSCLTCRFSIFCSPSPWPKGTDLIC